VFRIPYLSLLPLPSVFFSLPPSPYCDGYSGTPPFFFSFFFFFFFPPPNPRRALPGDQSVEPVSPFPLPPPASRARQQSFLPPLLFSPLRILTKNSIFPLASSSPSFLFSGGRGSLFFLGRRQPGWSRLAPFFPPPRLSPVFFLFFFSFCFHGATSGSPWHPFFSLSLPAGEPVLFPFFCSSRAGRASTGLLDTGSFFSPVLRT